jgi:hypothetical protein
MDATVQVAFSSGRGRVRHGYLGQSIASVSFIAQQKGGRRRSK